MNFIAVQPRVCGEQVVRNQAIWLLAVQPRVCGEQTRNLLSASTLVGSAPRVRGTGMSSCAITGNAWFSPACAGNRRNRAALASLATVQPRVCGEQLSAKWHSNLHSGSAPRVRGTVSRLVVRRQRGRFSPACAGNRLSASTRMNSTPVQPRVCGEQHTPGASTLPMYGSAPRVRGTGISLQKYRAGLRFSPACAGNSRVVVRQF